jgi:hypothetical protein
MGPQQIQEVLDKFGQFRLEGGKSTDVKPVVSDEGFKVGCGCQLRFARFYHARAR